MGAPEPLRILDGWSPWVSLETCWRGAPIPLVSGLYRIRRTGEETLDYIGQTGLPLRRRLAMLAGVYRPEMPYRDPHTAGPALWALRHARDCMFEASVLPVQGDARYRKGLEALALALYRQSCGHSPTVNFGRILQGYRLSSGNNAGLVAAGKRVRGGPDTSAQDNWTVGISPVGTLEGDVQSATWGGHTWSQWVHLPDAGVRLAPAARGLYRVRDPQLPRLVYVGEGYIRARVANHLGKANKVGHRQAPLFSAQLECSWVENSGWLRHQRVELETDLIGAHVLTTGQAPIAQFLG
jgi:hypothetical protein